MSYNCPTCRDQKVIHHFYPEGHSHFNADTVRVIEYCQCQGQMPTDSDYQRARGVCDRMASDRDYDELKKYINALPSVLRDRMKGYLKNQTK